MIWCFLSTLATPLKPWIVPSPNAPTVGAGGGHLGLFVVGDVAFDFAFCFAAADAWCVGF